MNVQRTLRQYVNEHGPVRACEAVRAVLPNAPDREQRIAYAALATDAAEGRLDRIAYGLYDRKL